MSSFLRLIRLPNLLMLLLTVFIYGKRILYATIADHGIAPAFRSKDFLSLLFVFSCVAAAGYIHNDLTDIKTDYTNDKRQIIGSTVTKLAAWVLLLFFILAPVPLVYYLCTEISDLNYIGYYFAVISLLLIYNKWLQRLPLIGNIVVAGVCSLVILLPAFAEIGAINQVLEKDPSSYRHLWMTTYGFAIFSFFANLIREIIKDVEDIEGDKSDGYNTLPIAVGINLTRSIILGLEIILFLILSTWIWYMRPDLVMVILLILFLIAPLVFVILKSWQARKIAHYGELSNWMKLYFGIGIIALVFIS